MRTLMVLFVSTLPKKHGFTKIALHEIEHEMNKLNNRPRTTLSINIPNKVFFGINPSVALAT